MITIIKNPLLAPYFNPTDFSCLEWTLQTPVLDLAIISGEKPLLHIEVPAAYGAPTGFTFHGHVFTATAGPDDYTSSTFKLEPGDQYKTAQNIANMLKANIDIYPYFQITAGWSGVPADPAAVDLLGNLNYVVPSPDWVDNLGGWTTFFANGLQGIYKQGYRMAWQLIQMNQFGFESQVMPLQTFRPRLNLFTGDTYTETIDFQEIVKTLCKTYFPAINANTPIFDPTILAKVYLKYGYIENISCNTFQSDFRNSPIAWIINQAIDIQNERGPEQFTFYASPLHQAVPLNQWHKTKIGVNRGSFNWLWFWFNHRLWDVDAEALAEITFLDCDDNIITSRQHEFDLSGGNHFDGVGVGILPVGGQNIFGGSMPLGTAKMAIWFGYDAGPPTGILQMTDTFYVNVSSFEYEHEFYFLGEFGGYETLPMHEMTEVSVGKTQDTITLQNICRDWALTGSEATENYIQYLQSAGAEQVSTVAKKKFKAMNNMLPRDEETIRLLEMFMKSEKRMYRLKYSGQSTLYAIKIVVDSSSAVITKDEGKVNFEFEFSFAQDLSFISEK